MTHSPRAAAVAAILLTPVLFGAPAQPPADVYQGTIRAVDARAGSVDIITGVGFALRLVQVRAVAATHIERAGAAIPLTALKPGDVVRADCRRTTSGLVADRIQKLDLAAVR